MLFIMDIILKYLKNSLVSNFDLKFFLRKLTLYNRLNLLLIKTFVLRLKKYRKCNSWAQLEGNRRGDSMAV
jgi:hypothetical protein